MSTLLKVDRLKTKQETTLGHLYIKDIQDGFTCEDAIRDKKVKGETAIPAGCYELKTRYSPRFSKEYYWSEQYKKLVPAADINKYSHITDFTVHSLIWVTNVPNYDFILIHWGNTKNDTEGCLLVGNQIRVTSGLPSVVNSRMYYIQFYEKVYPLIKAGGQMIEYINPN